MINEIYNLLRTPKSLEEIHLRFLEMGLDWNKYQMELFLNMDKNARQISDKWIIEEGNLSKKVIGFLDEIFRNKPIIPVSLVLKEIPVTIGKPELIKIVEESHSYFLHTNGAVICKK